MNTFLAIMQQFAPLLGELQHRPEDGEQSVSPEVAAELERVLGELRETVGRVQEIRNQRVDTTGMSIAEIDNLIRGH